jgi:hypothetical protein
VIGSSSSLPFWSNWSRSDDRRDQRSSLARRDRTTVGGLCTHRSFSRAHVRWLKACAQLELPDSEDEEFVLGTFLEERAALRELFLVPAACSETIWAKLAALESDLVREQVVGPAKDSILLFGLGAIKADLMNLGVKGEF